MKEFGISTEITIEHSLNSTTCTSKQGDKYPMT